MCRVCASPVVLYARSILRGRYAISFYECTTCSFVQSEHPYWLKESYADVIGPDDLGVVYRNQVLCRTTCVFARFLMRRDSIALDYAGGYGLLTRMMRDAGYEFRWYDPYCANLFARGFVGDADAEYGLVTAFEVLEHLENPLDLMARLLRQAPHVLVSTELLPAGRPKPEEWDYFHLTSGQHISFFTQKSMHAIAARLQAHYVGNGINLHLFSRAPWRWARLLFVRGMVRILAPFCRRGSLLNDDFNRIIAARGHPGGEHQDVPPKSAGSSGGPF